MLLDGGACDPSAVGGATRDSDCDGISDADELAFTWVGGGKTNACNPDSDGDGLQDGLEASINMMAAGCAPYQKLDADSSTRTNPMNADSDNDGLSDSAEDLNFNGRIDAMETSPTLADTDCDGLSDRIELQGSGTCFTNPLLPDTDNDGLWDGVERGVTGASYAGCVYVAPVFDADPATSTNACVADFDGDGILDGDEDVNGNGRVDGAEKDPRVGDLVFYGQACASDAGTRMDVRRIPEVDLSVAIPPDFAEVVAIKTSGNLLSGYLFQSSMRGVAAGVIVKRTISTSGPVEGDEFGYRSQFQGAPMGGGTGTLDAVTLERGTSWDGFPALTARYRLANNSTHITTANAMADALLGGGTSGALAFQVLDAGVQWVDVVMVKRSRVATVFVFAVSSASGNSVTDLARQSVARSTTAGQYADVVRRRCDVLSRSPSPQLDFLWVIDDSPNPAAQTANLQNNFANAMPAFTTAFTNGDVSARYALTTTSGTGANNKAWSPPLGNIGLWVADGGIFNYSDSERGFDAIASFLGSFPARGSTAFHTLVVTDAPEQSTATWTSVSVSLPTPTINGAPVPPRLSGIVCPDGVNCNDGTELNPGKLAAAARGSNGLLGDVRTFTTTNSAVQSATAQRIANYVVDSVGFSISGGPMPASARVTHTPADAGCPSSVPNARTNGFDMDVTDGTRLSFFGTCRSAVGAAVVQSTTFEDRSAPPGQDCFTPCPGNLTCDADAGACVCKGTCPFGCATGLKCDAASCSCVPR